MYRCFDSCDNNIPGVSRIYTDVIETGLGGPEGRAPRDPAIMLSVWSLRGRRVNRSDGRGYIALFDRPADRRSFSPPWLMLGDRLVRESRAAGDCGGPGKPSSVRGYSLRQVILPAGERSPHHRYTRIVRRVVSLASSSVSLSRRGTNPVLPFLLFFSSLFFFNSLKALSFSFK